MSLRNVFCTKNRYLRRFFKRSNLVAVVLLIPCLIFPPQVAAELIDETTERLSPQKDDSFDAKLVDEDGDGDADITVANAGRNRIHVNDNAIFTDSSEKLPTNSEKTLDVEFADVDGDGDLDIFAANAGQNKLYIKEPAGNYKDETVPRLPVDNDKSLDSKFLDVDNDNDPDIFIANVGSQNRLLINDGNGNFTDESAVRLPADADRSFGVDAADVNNDDMTDIIIANGGQNKLLINDGSGNYDDETATRLPNNTDISFDVDFGDLDDDNDPDIFVTNPDVRNRILLNNGVGIFTDRTVGRLPEDSDASVKAALADINGDTHLDIMVANVGQDRIYFNNGSGVFTDETDNQLADDDSRTFGLSFGDIDGDIDLDVVLAKPGAQNRLLVNKPDVVGPTVSVTANPSTANLGQEVLITVDARDNLRIAELTLEVEGQPVALDANNQARYIPTAVQSYNVEAKAKDPAGNETTASTTFSTVVDTTAPVVAVTVDKNQIFLGQSVSITVGATDNVGIAALDVDVNGQNLTLDANKQAVYTPAAPGSYTVTAVAQDAAGNSDTASANFAVVLDATAPDVTVTATPSTVDIGVPVTLTVGASDNVGVTSLELKVDGAPLQLDQNNQAVFTPAAPKTYTASATARDAAGNETTNDTAFVATPDTLPPVVTLDIEPRRIPSLGTTLITVGATDNIGVVSTALEIDGVDFPLTNNQALAEAQGTGVFTAKGIALDAAGNRGEKEDYVVAYNPADKRAPSVTAVNPTDGASDVRANTSVEVDFDEPIDPQSVTTNTFIVIPVGGQPISGSISFANNFIRAVFTPDGDLAVGTDYEVRLVGAQGGVSDLKGNVLAHDFSSTFTTIDPAEIPPVVTVAVDPQSVEVGNPVEVTVSATDNIGVASVSLEIDGQDVPLDQDGKGVFTPNIARDYTAIGRAIDTDGNEGTGTASFSATFSGVDDDVPVAEITSPPDDSEVTDRVDIIGTANDSNFGGYKLEYARKDEGDFVTIASGAAPVVNGVLGSFDPTMLMNDFYTIKLTVMDASGKSVSTIATYNVTGDLKLGNFTISFRDLEVPLAGIPISIVRTYDSRDKMKGDFGAGWRLEIRSVTAKENRVLGDGWFMASGGGLFPTYRLAPLGDHTVNISHPHEPRRFTFTPFLDDPHDRRFGTVAFNETSRTGSQLYSLRSDSLIFQGGQLFDLDFNVFDPSDYQLKARNKTTFDINQPDGLRHVAESNGNHLDITSNGIFHSSGKSITYTRDGHGRITEITDPNGSTLHYTYDSRGDLTIFEDRMGNKSAFEYDRNHNLLRIIDPEGRIIENLYDEEGRRSLMSSPAGNVIDFTYDLDNRSQTISDEGGTQVTLQADQQGRITFATDPFGNVTEFVYDADGNLISKIDPLGNRTDRAYDQAGKMTSETDALGRTTSYTYNAAGKVLTVTNAKGDVTTYTYDANNNVTSITDVLGNPHTFTYDANGCISSSTGARGDRLQIDCTSEGYIRQLTGPTGVTQKFDEDAFGNVTSHRVVRRTDSGVEEPEIRRSYNSNAQIASITDPDGNSASFAYNAASQLSSVADRNGNKWKNSYDENGFASGISLPTGVKLTKTADFHGLVTESTEPNGSKVKMDYDLAGRETKRTFGDGTFETYTQDALGRVISITKTNGLTVNKTYDAVGNLTSVDFEGEVTTFKYDQLNNLIERTDANGHTTRYEYDAFGRRTKTVFPDGSSIEFEYDEGGNRISETNQLGQTTRFEYNGRGELVKVIDPLGHETTITYDDLMPKLLKTVTDADGDTTRYDYDSQGRLIRIALPLGQHETRTYDKKGNLTSITDFNGDTIRFESDEIGHMKAKTLPDGSRLDYVTNTAGEFQKISSPLGEYIFEYNPRGMLTRYAQPDGQEVRYNYDSGQNLTEVITPYGTVSYTYDNHNRVATVTDTNGGITQYSYDAVENVTSIVCPNGNTTTYAYDALNRIVSIATRNSSNDLLLSFDYERDAAGNITRVVENSGRIVDYQYDALNRLVREDIQDPVLGNDTIVYTYDAVGNRLSKTDSSGTVSYVYDNNDRLLSAGSANYTYDNNGNVLTVTKPGSTASYSYDFENRLTRVERNANGNLDIASYTYDYNGIRLSQNINGAETRFLIDKAVMFPRVLAEVDPINGVVVEYTYADRPLTRVRGGVSAYFHEDVNNSIRALSQADGSLTDAYTYSSFGELINHGGASDNQLLYAGEYSDTIGDLIYLRGRHYAPEIGRFNQRDVLLGDLFSPQTLNRYVYGLNNPIVNTDPSGLVSLTQLMVVVTIIAILAVVASTAYTIHKIFYSIKNPFKRFSAHRFAAMGSFTGGGFGQLGISSGVEALDFGKSVAFYLFTGPAASLFNMGRASVSWALEYGRVYQTPTPGDYEGWFIGFSVVLKGVITQLLMELAKQGLPLGDQISLFTSPGPTKTNPDFTSHGWGYGITGSSTPIGWSGFATYYVLVHDEAKAANAFRNIPRERWGRFEQYLPSGL